MENKIMKKNLEKVELICEISDFTNERKLQILDLLRKLGNQPHIFLTNQKNIELLYAYSLDFLSFEISNDFVLMKTIVDEEENTTEISFDIIEAEIEKFLH